MVGNTHRKPDGAELVDPPDDFAMTPGIRPAKDGQGDFDLLDQLTRSPDVDQWDLDPGLGYSGPNVIEDSRVKRARLPTLEGCYESILYPSEFFVTGRVWIVLFAQATRADDYSGFLLARNKLTAGRYRTIGSIPKSRRSHVKHQDIHCHSTGRG